MTAAAMLVLNAFVLRGDSSPAEGQRRARPGYNQNPAGQGIEDEGVQDRTLAISRAPHFEWEAFDQYWRKVHGPKVIFKDGPADDDTALLGFYLQQHRIPAGPCSGFAPPYGPALDDDGRLSTQPVSQCPPYRRPPFDGLAQLGWRARADLEGFFLAPGGKYAGKIMPDEAVFIRGFAYHLAEEHVVVHAGNSRRDAIILIKLHVRAVDNSREAFRGHWMAQHADLVRQLPAARALVRRYVQLVNVSTPTDGLYDPQGDRYDGVGVYSFSNMNDCEDFIASSAHAALEADERAFTAETSYFTALNYVICDTTG